MKNITKVKNISILVFIITMIFSICSTAFAELDVYNPNKMVRTYTLNAKYNGEVVDDSYSYTYTANYLDDGLVESTIKGKIFIINPKDFEGKNSFGDIEIELDIADSKVDDNLQIAYRINDEEGEIKTNGTKKTTLIVPKFAKGTTNYIQLESATYDKELGYAVNSNRKLVVIIVPNIQAYLVNGNTQISPDSKLKRKAGSTLTAQGVAVPYGQVTTTKLTYKWDSGEVQERTGDQITFKVPETFKEGEEHKLTLQAFTKEGMPSDEAIYTIIIGDGPANEQSTDFDVEKDNKKLTPNVETPARPGDVLTITTTDKDNIVKYTYKWENYPKDTAEYDVDVNNPKITIPSDFEPGKTYKLIIYANLKDGTKTPEKVYIFKIGIAGNVEVKYDGSILKAGSSTKGKEGEEVELSGNPTTNFSKLFFKWDDGSEQELLGGSGKTTIPKTSLSSHKLVVHGLLTDGTSTSNEEYTFTKGDSDDIDTEPWMILNEDAEGLLVSLRNDSENDSKANKNFYMLDEEVTYYVDYLNAGKAIDGEVKITLELPLTIKEISLDGGTLSTEKKNNVITWTFANGLEKDKGGTKIVKIKYTELSKKSNTSETIYPLAQIYKASKVQDKSAVINCIYKDEETALEESHVPYMYGDKEKPTFRPNDGISRAEGAQVLLRIFGVDYSKTLVDDRFSDITDTYLEARRAITKAAELKIIDGYTDGTYKPNKKMTRAEFMKIIASYIEVKAEQDDIEGLELKEDTIKIYNNKSKSDHWAIKWVTMLARLNMTSASEKEKDLRLEDVITRAETAQLVNFYAFRAPAKISSSITIQFEDVQRTHKLIGDIIEATREAHDVYVNEEGKEIVKRSK